MTDRTDRPKVMSQQVSFPPKPKFTMPLLPPPSDPHPSPSSDCEGDDCTNAGGCCRKIAKDELSTRKITLAELFITWVASRAFGTPKFLECNPHSNLNKAGVLDCTPDWHSTFPSKIGRCFGLLHSTECHSKCPGCENARLACNI